MDKLTKVQLNNLKKLTKTLDSTATLKVVQRSQQYELDNQDYDWSDQYRDND